MRPCVIEVKREEEMSLDTGVCSGETVSDYVLVLRRWVPWTSWTPVTAPLACVIRT